MWRVGQSYKSLILRQCYCSVQCQCVCLVTDVSIVVFLFIQITASKLMSDFRLSTFTVSIVSGKWVFGYVVLGSFTTRATKVLKILGGLVKRTLLTGALGDRFWWSPASASLGLRHKFT